MWDCGQIFIPYICFNRTFMELKFMCANVLSSYIGVSIVPLWNWNWHIAWVDARKGSVSIVPLWNWNAFAKFSAVSLASFNRTFMELKCMRAVGRSRNVGFQSYLYGIEICKRSNGQTNKQVSIVPLWNWNTNTSIFKPLVRKCFNRTFMELKY